MLTQQNKSRHQQRLVRERPRNRCSLNVNGPPRCSMSSQPWCTQAPQAQPRPPNMELKPPTPWARMSLSSFTVHHLSCSISDANVVHRELKSENLRQPLCAEQKTSSSGSNAHRENLYPWNTHRQTRQTQMTYNLPCNVPNTFVWGDKVDFFKGVTVRKMELRK